MRTTTIGMIFLTSALAGALVFGSAMQADAQAGEASPREAVRQLLPRLQSEDAAVRDRAEAELFRLGERGKLEMERVSRDADTRHAEIALRLLQSERWAKAPLRDGEEPLVRVGSGLGSGSDSDTEAVHRSDGFRVLSDDFVLALERRFRELEREMERAWSYAPHEPSADAGAQATGPLRGAVSRTAEGSVTLGERRLTWRRAADGHVRATTRDGDGEKRSYEAEDLKTFRQEYPEVVAELDRVAPAWASARSARLPGRLWGRFPDVRALREFATEPFGRLHSRRDGRDSRRTLAGDPGGHQARSPLLGIEWAAVSPLLRVHLNLGDAGVVVERVLPDTHAAQLQLKAMDVLVELAGKPIRTRADIVSALREAGAAPIDAVVIRRGARYALREPE